MRLGFLELPLSERRLYIEQGATRRNVSPVILEKDFWVCWLLGILFESEFAGSLVFKGGTSLSKVFGVIERFSEDIDLSLSPAFLKLPEAGTSRNKANKWMARAEAACGDAVQNQIGPAMEVAVAGLLGRSERTWFEFLTDSHTNSPVLLFHYPSSQPAGFEYLKRSVKLEFGSLTDQQPVGRHPVRPWIADAIPAAFPDWRCEVVALDVGRTFWEKATILHTEYHRPAKKPTPDRYSRHYADIAALAKHPTASKAIDQHELRNNVVQWKSLFFGSSWANYDQAKPGTFHLVPPSDRLAAAVPCGILPPPLPHLTMARFLTVKEAARLTGKSPSSIRRVIYPIIHDDNHADREHVQPSVADAVQLRMKGENFPWRLSEDLLRREVPPETTSSERGSVSSAKAVHPDGDLLAMLRAELQIKNQQIGQQSELIAKQMDLISGLTERLREGNILIGSLQQHLALGDGRNDTVITAETSTPQKRSPSKPAEKGSTMNSKSPKPRKSFLSRFFG